MKRERSRERDETEGRIREKLKGGEYGERGREGRNGEEQGRGDEQKDKRRPAL